MARRARTSVLAIAVLALLGGGQVGCAWLSGYDGDDYALAGDGAGGSGAGGSGAGGSGAGGLGGGGAGGMFGGGGSGGAVSCAPNLHAGPEQIVFILRARAKGNLGGIAGADDSCNKAAEDCLGGGAWLAFLSTEGNPASGRFNSASGPWVRPDGQQVFPNVAALNGKPSVPINLDERGRSLPSSGPVWTGTSFGVVSHPPSGSDCNGWNDSTANAKGEVTASDGLWTNTDALPCDDVAHLYCFETVDE